MKALVEIFMWYGAIYLVGGIMFPIVLTAVGFLFAGMIYLFGTIISAARHCVVSLKTNTPPVKRNPEWIEADFVEAIQAFDNAARVELLPDGRNRVVYE